MKLTGFVLLAVVVGLLGFDLIQMIAHGPDATISAFIWNLSHDWLIVPFLVGMICGHLFFPMRDK